MIQLLHLLCSLLKPSRGFRAFIHSSVLSFFHSFQKTSLKDFL